MIDIDISPQSWGDQSSGLRQTGASVQEIGGAATGTMAGNPYGVVLTPIFQPRYMEVSGEFQNANSSLGEALEATAEALDASAAEFIALEEKIKEEFERIIAMIESVLL
ncbi:hypothetical protein V7R84_06835 [Arachnia propionica]|uniref:hypothetical protein n=1 Tax=Arachnia propionica TaxID=1750 RepID=UPI0030D517FE